MTDVKFTVVVGRLRRNSMNRTLALALEKLAPPRFLFAHLSHGDLPLYNQDGAALAVAGSSFKPG